MQELVLLQSLVQVYDISLLTFCLSKGQKLNPVMLVFYILLWIRFESQGGRCSCQDKTYCTKFVAV